MMMRGLTLAMLLLLAWVQPAFARLPDAYPKSRPCLAQDLKKPWRLQGLWEEPEGTFLREYSAFPYQYLAFENGNSYYSYYSRTRPKDTEQLRVWMQKARAQAHADLRYVLNDKGALYLYRGKNVVASATCNIVTQWQGRFAPGWMWLYQAIRAPDIKLVRLFSPINVLDEQPPLPPIESPNAKVNNKPANKKRK